MAREQQKPGFALTTMEQRTLIVLALLLVIGLVGKQVDRWFDKDATVQITGSSPEPVVLSSDLDSDTLRAEDVSGSLAPSTSQDVPSKIRAASSFSDSASTGMKSGADRSAQEHDTESRDLSSLPDEDVRMRVTNPEMDSGSQSGRQDAAGRFELNTATAEQLVSIPGIGDVLAGRVLEWRKQHGSFKTVDDLLLIEGIGEKRLATMKQYVYVQPRN